MLNELTAEGFLLLVVKLNNYFTIFSSSSSERSTEIEPSFVSFLIASVTSFEWYNSITFFSVGSFLSFVRAAKILI